MIKKALFGMAAVIAISLVLAACFVESDPDDIPEGEVLLDSSGKTVSGTATKTENGYVGPITVTLTVKDGYISEVLIDGPRDQVSKGGDIIRNAPDMIKRANSFDIDALASVTPAYATKGAIREAGKKALKEITGN